MKGTTTQTVVTDDSLDIVADTANLRPYKALRKDLELNAEVFAQVLVNAMTIQGINITRITVKRVENPLPTLTGVKTAHKFTVTVEGEPYERPQLQTE